MLEGDDASIDSFLIQNIKKTFMAIQQSLVQYQGTIFENIEVYALAVKLA